MPKKKEKHTIKVAGRRYSESAREDALSTAFEDTLRVFNNGVSPLDPRKEEAASGERSLSRELDDVFINKYIETFGDLKPSTETAHPVNDDQPLTSAAKIKDQSFEKTEIYKGFFREYNIFNYEYHALVRPDGVMAGFSISLPERKKIYGKKERGSLDKLLKRSISDSLADINRSSDHDVLADTINKMTRPALIVDQNVKVRTANSRAAKILEANDGLSVDKSGSLIARNPEATKDLHATLHSVHSQRRDGDPDAGAICLLRRPSGDRQLQLLASPIGETTGNDDDCLTIIFLCDPERSVRVSEAVLRKLYDLTPAEAAVASRLAKGESVEQICDHLTITANTCRTHLKRIYSKTSTSRQGELISLILTSIATIPDPS
ncbi:MAG: helix-turn-helix transcriptional regulator [Acidobacteria bacterium]|nr:helix-turn-helix transcriptional regulator [Acidobacteriota bacterium]